MTDMYLLVRPAVDSMYDLGSHPDITNVESITFSVGVDQAHNHLDPASYPASHPLAPQNVAGPRRLSRGPACVSAALLGPLLGALVVIHALLPIALVAIVLESWTSLLPLTSLAPALPISAPLPLLTLAHGHLL